MERVRRQKGADPIQYIVSDKTSLKNTNLKKLLPHASTKGEITQYFSKHLISLENETNHKVLCSLENFILATTACDNMMDLQSSHEEADPKLILHSVRLHMKLREESIG